MKYIFTITTVCILFFLGCKEKISTQENEILNGQYVEKNNEGLIKTIGNFENGKREGQFIYFDTKGKLPGGNGISFDWKILTSYKFNKPYFLSGGIGLHNIEQLKDFFSSTISKYCFAVDINSHFEIEYAKKDYELIKNFKNEL